MAKKKKDIEEITKPIEGKYCFDDSFCKLDLDCLDCEYYKEVHAGKQPEEAAETTQKVLTVVVRIPKEGTNHAILNELARQLKIMAEFITEDKGDNEVQIPSNGACNKGDTFANFSIREE